MGIDVNVVQRLVFAILISLLGRQNMHRNIYDSVANLIYKMLKKICKGDMYVSLENLMQKCLPN